MQPNPLEKYFRVPRCYVKLPSRGRFYPKGFVETAANGEVAVYPLSAMDQILLKTPDAVLNGEALLKVVRNCVPGVQDPKKLVEPDINSLLLAMRIASNGTTSEWTVTCPNCKSEHQFDVDLSHMLESQQFVEEDPIIDFNGELRIRVRPYDFEQRNLQLLNEIEESQTLAVINNSDMEEKQKISRLSAHVDSMAQRTFDTLSLSIVSIEIVSSKEIVTDRNWISEFLKGISRTQADTIINAIRELNRVGINTTQNFSCSSCGHEWQQPLDFDPTSFFD